MKTNLHWGVALFTLLWALAVLLPTTRETARTIISLSRSHYLIVPPSSNDPIAEVWQLEIEQPSQSRAQKWDALLARVPDQPWLIAAYLRSALSEGSWLQGGHLAFWKKGDTRKQRNAEKAAQLAVRMEQKEPTNAYWPWMEAGFRFVLGQHEQAIKAMERAGNASHFQDYNQSTVRDRLQWFDQHAHPTWEERLGISYGMLFPDFSFLSATCRETASEAVRAHTRGDNATAIREGAFLLHATQIWRRDSNSFLGAIIAQNTGYNVLASVLNQKITTDYTARLTQQRELCQRWEQFAQSNGRSDVMSSANWLQKDSPTLLMNLYAGTTWQQFGLPAPWGHIAVLVPIFLTGVFGLCFGFAFLWLSGRWLSRTQNEAPARGQVVLCANFSFWALVGVSLLLGLALLASSTGGLDLILAPFVGEETKTSLPVVSCAVAALVCWLLPVWFVNWKRGHRYSWVWPESKVAPAGLPRQFGLWRVGVWLSFLFFVAVVASNGNGMWDDTLLSPSVSVPLSILGLIGALTLELVRYQRTGRILPRLRLQKTPFASSVPRVWQWLRSGGCLIAIAGVSGFWAISGNWMTASPLALICLGVGAVGALASIILTLNMARQDRFFIQLAFNSAGVLSLACSFAFLVLALGAWPLRAELNRQLDRRMTMTEVAWTKEQIAKNPQTSP